MNIDNLHTLLSGPFYIDSTYGISCLPTVYKVVSSNVSSENGREQKISSLQRSVAASGDVSAASSKKVIVVDFKQPVLKFDSWPWLGTQTYISILQSLANDESIAGVVLDIDSGGGQVYGTPEFYDFISSYPKPIAAYTGGYMCSGAYYIGASTNRIFANKRADAIGSIGAYATIIDAKGVWEHFGAKVHTIYATDSTDKNAAYRDVVDNANYESYIKNELDPIVATFVSDMKASRPQLNEEVFKGGTWSGSDALSMGLIDQVGTLNDAISFVFNESLSTSNSNTNTNMNTKSLPKVEAVLGLDAPLALTDNGSYLNASQLDAIEARIGEMETNNSTLQTQLTEAQTANTTSVEAVQNQLTVATNSLTAVEASVDAVLENAGLPIEGTLTEKLAAINGKAEAFGKLDGDTNTKVKIDANNTPEGTTVVGGVDVSAALNN